MTTWLVTALVLGMVGSLHCMGMCGPLVMALNPKGARFTRLLAHKLVYNLGRVLAYSLIGALAGALGYGLVQTGVANIVAITMGGLLALGWLLPAKHYSKVPGGKLLARPVNYLKRSIGRYLGQQSYGSAFFVGFLNGWLPCGLVYMALAAAVTTSSALWGSLYMAVFGLGTLPMLLVVALGGQWLKQKLPARLNKLVPVYALILALFLIYRGLALGLPFSPALPNSPGELPAATLCY